jgi:hypothetical protein
LACLCEDWYLKNRIQNGSFFTPSFITMYMCEKIQSKTVG